MKYLTIILLALIIGCGSSPTEQESEYPKRIGTWEVLNEMEAEWIGSKSKADTTFITDPNDRRLSIMQKTVTNFDMVLVDSTVTTSNYNIGDVIFDFDAGMPGYGLNISENRMRISMDFYHSCESSSGILFNSGDLLFTLVDGVTGDSLSYSYNIEGAQETVEAVMCD